ncbi:Sulredoxin [Porphyridium purpureum]|uniref:Sulredoxin n=1 Tax=Porphyridium purpureum TaxID=35688 RepID=A0A5J4Z037_PORPP|nr:Sulredoxin [Porphyridium purpureum]|eukprot:POR8423..scf208_2
MAFVGCVSGLKAAQTKRAPRVCEVKMAWTPVTTKDEIDAAGGFTVVKTAGKKVLIKELDGQLYAVSNKCSHLGLPIEGKILKAKFSDTCVTCAAHGSQFDIKTGEVVEWCPTIPNWAGFAKAKPAPLPTFPVRISGNGQVEIDV